MSLCVVVGMAKKAGLIVVLLLVGVAIAMYLRGGSSTDRPQAFTPRTDATETERIVDLEKALAAQVDRANLFETRMREMEVRLTRNSYIVGVVQFLAIVGSVLMMLQFHIG